MWYEVWLALLAVCTQGRGRPLTERSLASQHRSSWRTLHSPLYSQTALTTDCDGSTGVHWSPLTSFHLTAAICKDGLRGSSQCFLYIMLMTVIRVWGWLGWLSDWQSILWMSTNNNKEQIVQWDLMSEVLVRMLLTWTLLFVIWLKFCIQAVSQPSHLPWCDPGKNCLIYRHHRVGGAGLLE